MENLLDKREKLKEKQKELQEMRLQAKDLKTKMMTKDAQADIDELKVEFDSLEERVKALEDEVLGLDNEITEEEKSLEAVASGMKTKNVYISTGGKKVDYLKSKESVKDFAEIVAKGLDGQETRALWEEHTRKKGVTGTDILLPQAVVSAITDVNSDDKAIFDTFNHTGLSVFSAGFNTNETWALAHKDGETKKEMDLNLTKKEIRPDYIYTYLTLAKKVIREQKDTGALTNYILKVMPKAIYKTIAKGAMVGNPSGAANLPTTDTYEPIVRAEELYKEDVTATENFFEDLINMYFAIESDGDKFLVMSKANLAKIRLSKDGAGAYLFNSTPNIAEALGFKAIFTPDWMGSIDPMVAKAIAYTGDSYCTVGDNAFDSYENFLLSLNKQEFLMEVWSGGALMEGKSAAVLKEVSA